MGDVDDTLAAAARELYAAAPDDFLATRGELVQRARADGAGDAAREIAKLRKPTLAAWIVNALALSDDTVAERVTDLGDRLRSAQQALDARLLRELSQERRSLVAGLASDALRLAGRPDPSTTTRDEVRASFDAAIADPGIAARLGGLQRAESFSGFGFGDVGGAPQLTLVRGGKRDEPTTGKPKAAAKKTAEPKADPKKAQADAARQRAVAEAREDVAQAEGEVSAARASEKETADHVKAAERALTDAKEALAAAKSGRDKARDAHRKAVAKRRDTRRALDRAEKGR